MKLWTIALSAKKLDIKKGHWGVTITSGAVVKPDQDSARGAALRLCKEEFPPLDGWGEHGISVNEIPQELIEQIK